MRKESQAPLGFLPALKFYDLKSYGICLKTRNPKQKRSKE
jgi:hypothetical protein